MAKENNTEIRQQNLSDLPDDILLLVSSKLSSSFIEMSNLKETCSSWRIAMRNRTTESYMALLLLGGSEKKLKKVSPHGIDDSIVINNDFFLFFFNEKRQYKFKKFPWFNVEGFCSKVVGSHPDGWVILSDKNGATTLLHLFLEIHIQLPDKMITDNGSLGQLNGDHIEKVIVSASHPTWPEEIIVVISFHKKLAFWRRGDCDCDWTCFGGESSVLDIACCNNTLYVITDGFLFNGYLELWDLKDYFPLRQKKMSIPIPSDQGLKPYLVVSPAHKLYIVVNYNSYSRPTKLIIYKLHSNKKAWIHKKWLNGQTLLLCFGASMVISSTDVERLGYKANSIYLAEKEEKNIRLSTYCFDNSVCKLMETGSYLEDEFQQLQPFGLFLLSA